MQLQKRWGIIMQKVGIEKEIDSLGRLQIPKEIRNRLKLGKTVELVVTDEGLLVKNSEYRLVKIDMKENLTNFD